MILRDRENILTLPVACKKAFVGTWPNSAGYRIPVVGLLHH
jgi:hypothetical protein